MAIIDDSAEVIRIRRPWGWVELSNNEVTIHSEVDDPPGLRLHSKSDSLGKVSFSKVRPDGSADEHVLVQGKKDERTRGRDDLPYGELTVHIKGPERFPGDDGMRPTFVGLHDYTWAKNFDIWPEPRPPLLMLPPPPEPPEDDWLTPESQAKHRDELDAIAAEFAAVGGPEFVPDEKTRDAYLSGRNRDLQSIHDDMVTRAGFDPGPCQWKDT
jgi:hypothetical protein